MLDLLNELRVNWALAVLFISHDLGVVATLSDRILVLEQGELRETGSCGDPHVAGAQLHP